MLLCYVTDRRLLGSDPALDDLLLRIERAAASGIDWLQIREKDLCARELLELARRTIVIVENESSARRRNEVRATARVIVNDHLDVALAAGAGGVHLGGSSIPAAEVVRWCRAGNAPADFLVGASCHDIHEAIEAERAGVDYIFYGPIFETPSKTSFGPPQGIKKLAEVCRRIRIPVLAIGGIDQENSAACLRAGAAGIAAIRLFQQLPNAEAFGNMVSRIRAVL